MKYFVLAFFGLALALASCKKEGCTDLDASNFDGKAKKDDGSCTYDIAPVVIDTICDGVQIDNTFYPLYSGLNKISRLTVYGSPNTVSNYYEQILGQELIGGVLWYKVRTEHFIFGEGFFYLRKDPLTGDLYRKNTTGEDLIMPGSPQLGQAVLDGYFIVDLNATKTTDACTYTGCLKVEKPDGALGVQTLWFKRGIGKVAYLGNIEESELIEIYDFQ